MILVNYEKKVIITKDISVKRSSQQLKQWNHGQKFLREQDGDENTKADSMERKFECKCFKIFLLGNLIDTY